MYPHHLRWLRHVALACSEKPAPSSVTVAGPTFHFLFTPNSRHVRCKTGCPLWANSGHRRRPVLLRKIKEPSWESTYIGRHVLSKSETRLRRVIFQRCFLIRTRSDTREIDCRRLNHLHERLRFVRTSTADLHSDDWHSCERSGGGHRSSARCCSARRRRCCVRACKDCGATICGRRTWRETKSGDVQRLCADRAKERSGRRQRYERHRYGA